MGLWKNTEEINKRLDNVKSLVLNKDKKTLCVLLKVLNHLIIYCITICKMILNFINNKCKIDISRPLH